jgi:hypothetical protein
MGLGSGIRKKPIPDPGVKKAPDSGSRIRNRNTGLNRLNPNPQTSLNPDPEHRGAVESTVMRPNKNRSILILCSQQSMGGHAGQEVSL